MTMLILLSLVLLGTLQVALPLPDSGLLTGEHCHMAVCVETIAKRHFSPGRATLVSFPGVARGLPRRTLEKFTTNSEMHLLHHTLQHMHEETLWPITTTSLSYVPLNLGYESYWKMDHYIIFLWSTEEGSVMDSLRDQVQELKQSSCWNNRAVFLVAVTQYPTKDASQLALEIIKELWELNRILNVDVLIPQTISKQPAIDTHDGNIETSTFDLYTWFPYQSERKCTDVQDTVLIDSWILEGQGRFLKEVPLFPAKIHKNFHGCPLKISPIDVKPLVIKDNYTDENNTVKFVYYGLEAECCKLITTTLNITPVFLPVTSFGLQVRVDMLTDLGAGTTDLTFGSYPLHELVHPFVDSTVSYMDDYMTWYVPCGKPVPRMEKISQIFTVSVWLMTAFVFILSVVVMWLGAQRAQNSDLNESSSYMKISNSFQNVWAISLGLAARELPQTPKLRSYFCLFVWYCFSISTLFQTYFTSFLIDPGIKQRITTLEELYSSDLVYHYNEENNNFIKFSFESYYSKITLRKTECATTVHCLYDFLRSQTFALIDHSFLTDYYTSIINKPELCTLDVAIYRLSFAMHLEKGSHLLHTFNDIICRILQAGLIGKWWNDQKTTYKLTKSNHSSIFPNFMDFNRHDNDYFVFSVSHLQLAFYVIGVGGLVGLVVLMAEILHYKFFKKPQVLAHTPKVRYNQRFYQTVIT
jgi:hypothetical protein